MRVDIYARCTVCYHTTQQYPNSLTFSSDLANRIASKTNIIVIPHILLLWSAHEMVTTDSNVPHLRDIVRMDVFEQWKAVSGHTGSQRWTYNAGRYGSWANTCPESEVSRPNTDSTSISCKCLIQRQIQLPQLLADGCVIEDIHGRSWPVFWAI